MTLSLLPLLLACQSSPLHESPAAPDLDAHADLSERSAAGSGLAAEMPARNFLVVVLDDVGTDQSVCYSKPVATRAPQPTIEMLCRNGVAFEQAWASPYCSPTRAGLLTGRLGSRTGVGAPLSTGTQGPSLDEYSLPSALKDLDRGYTTAAFGKWHLADATNGGPDHPNLMGFDHYAGNLKGYLSDFESWTKIVDGEETTSTTYATTELVDDAADWIAEQDGPWFAWLAFHSPHAPFHLPPTDLHSYDDLSGSSDDIAANPEDYYQAMLESVDTELGRLLETLGEDVLSKTVIIVVGDNGTDVKVNQGVYPGSKSKGTLYEGGVRVPLIIGGPGLISGGKRVAQPVNTLDLFSTVIELAGGNVEELVPEGTVIDSVSLVPTLTEGLGRADRDFVVSEVFGGRINSTIAGQAVSDGRFKLKRLLTGEEELLDIVADPTESTNLLETNPLPIPAELAYLAFDGVLSELPIED